MPLDGVVTPSATQRIGVGRALDEVGTVVACLVDHSLVASRTCPFRLPRGYWLAAAAAQHTTARVTAPESPRRTGSRADLQHQVAAPARAGSCRWCDNRRQLRPTWDRLATLRSVRAMI